MMKYRVEVTLTTEQKKNLMLSMIAWSPDEMALRYPDYFLEFLDGNLRNYERVIHVEMRSTTVDMAHDSRLHVAIQQASRLMSEAWNMMLPREPVRRAAELIMVARFHNQLTHYPTSAVYLRTASTDSPSTLIRRYSSTPQLNEVPIAFLDPYYLFSDPLKVLIADCAEYGYIRRLHYRFMYLPSFHPVLADELGKYYTCAAYYVMEALVDFVTVTSDLTIEPEMHLAQFHEGLRILMDQCKELNKMSRGEALQRANRIHSIWHEEASRIMICRLHLDNKMKALVS